MKENERNSSLKIIIADPKACLLSVVVVIDLFTQSTDVVFLELIYKFATLFSY